MLKTRSTQGVFSLINLYRQYLKWQANAKVNLIPRYVFKKTIVGGITSQYGYYVSCFRGDILFFQVGYYYEFYSQLPLASVKKRVIWGA